MPKFLNDIYLLSSLICWKFGQLSFPWVAALHGL